MNRNVRLPGWPLAFVVLALFGLFINAALPRSVLTADVHIFQDRVSAILDGNLPYFDTLYEHLPLALPPMLLPRLLPGGDEILLYIPVFAALMTACLVLIGIWLERIAADVQSERTVMRWAIITAPLIPLVAFRVDPLPTMFTVLAVYLSFVTVHRSALWAGLAGVASKGWPVVLAPIEWWAGRRRRAVALVGFAVALGGGLLLTPGFQEGREFSGVHLETIAGSVIVWLRSVFGAESGIFGAAGATYVSAPGVTLLVGAFLGAGLLWLTRSLWRHAVSTRTAVQLVGVVTLALLLASPLLSAQFLLWLTPWLVFFESRRLERMFLAANVVNLALMLDFSPAEFIWQSGLLLRNGLLVAMAVHLVMLVRQRAATGERVAARG